MRSTGVMVLAIMLASGVATAAPPRGVVLRVEGNEIFIDLGSSVVQPGDTVTHFRTIVVTHPVSKKKITDRFPTGEFQLIQVEPTMSMGRAPLDVLAQLKVGDQVALVREEPEPPASPAPAPAASPSPSASPGPLASPEPSPSPGARPEPREVDPETRAVVEAWNATLGRAVRERVEIWKDYLRRFPRSKYQTAVLGELDTLAELEAREVALARGRAAVTGVRHQPPSPAPPDRELELAFALNAAVGPIDAAWVHYRRRGAATYQRAELAREGDGYLRGMLPAAVVAPGGVEYFVEVARGGTTATAVGLPDAPLALEVGDVVVRRQSRRHRSRVSLRGEYVDFNRGQGNDWYGAAEADFAYRWLGRLRALRMGAGVFRGEGGPTEEIDADPEACRASGHCKDLGFNYAYTELEFALTPRLATLTRAIVGLTPDGLGGGFQGKLRLGPEDGTNLLLAGALASQMGGRLELALNFEPLRKIPMTAAVQVADEPVESNLGVRLLMDIGSRHLRSFQPTLRVSYSARTIHHSGFGAGLAAVFAW